jgi:flavodoxin
MLFFSILFALTIGNIESGDNSEVISEVTPAEPEPKILVVYFSRTGVTEKISELIAVALNADKEKLVDKKDRSGTWGYLVAGKDAGFGNETEIEPVKHNPSDYDLVIIGTPIWAWSMTPAIRTYINQNKGCFKKVVFFTTSGGTGYDKVVPSMEQIVGKEAVFKNGFLEKEVKEDSPGMVKKLNNLIDLVKKETGIK